MTQGVLALLSHEKTICRGVVKNLIFRMNLVRERRIKE